MNPSSLPRRTSISSTIACGVTVFGCLMCLGCGLEQYEQRLKATEDYYNYQDRIERSVSSPWKSPPIDSLRVPLQFQEIQPAQPSQGAEENSEDAPKDSRQPDYASITIPGLIGAWRAEVDAQVGENRELKPVYLYVATNHQMLLGDKTDALGFLESLLTSLEADLQTSRTAQGVASYPKGHQYSPRQDFENYVLTGDMAIHDVRYIFDVYTTKNGDNQVAIILVRPDGMDPMSKIQDRLQMTLETLLVSAAPPQPNQPPAGGAQPAGPAPAKGSF